MRSCALARRFALVTLVVLVGCRKHGAGSEGDVETVLETNGSHHSLVAGGSSLFWMDPSVTPNVLYMRRGGGNAVRLWTVDGKAGSYNHLAANDKGAFVTESVAIDGGSAAWQTKFVPADGASPFLFSQTFNDAPLAIASDEVAFADHDRVLVAKVGAPARLIARTETPAIALALRAGQVYWLERAADRAEGDLRSAPVTPGPPVTRAKGIVLPRRRDLSMLAVDAAAVYYLDVPRSSVVAPPDAAVDEAAVGYSEVRAVSLGDGSVRTVYNAPWPIRWFTVFDGRVYAYELEPKSESRGRLRSKSLRDPGEPRIEVASDDDPVKQVRPPFVIDASWITWGNLVGLHRIRRR